MLLAHPRRKPGWPSPVRARGMGLRSMVSKTRELVSPPRARGNTPHGLLSAGETPSINPRCRVHMNIPGENRKGDAQFSASYGGAPSSRLVITAHTDYSTVEGPAIYHRGSVHARSVQPSYLQR